MKRHALFVGVNTYDDPAIRPLRFSVPDASVLADRFGRLGFETRLLPDPTGPELLSAVEAGVVGLGPGDVFLFFFAGHGFTAQDGAHLLFCKNDRRKLLRVNGAGVRVDALEALTDDGGFHRAFLLDSCRTDCFAGVDVRGDETRDLDFVAMPKPLAGAGSFYLLRSCDKFRPSLELDDLGHGLFTQGLLDAMDARDGRLAVCDTSFAAAVRDQMAELQRRHHVVEPQRPSLGEVSGSCFALFQEGFLAARQSASGLNLTSAPALVVCHRCGRRKNPLDTFRCHGCQRDFCLDHQDADTFLCPACAEKARREESERRAAEERTRREREAAERKAATERARREREEAERKAREASEAKALQDRAEKERQAREAERLRRLAEMRSAGERKKREDAARKAKGAASARPQSSSVGAVGGEFYKEYDNGGVTGKYGGSYVAEEGHSVYRGDPIRAGEFGQGVWESNTGKRYEGGFRYDVPWGCTPGLFEGHGIFTDSDGSRYEGEWQFGKKHGRGRLTYPNGDYYDGNWSHDVISGSGTFQWKSGDRYEGEFKKGVKCGHGKYTWPSGAYYDGEWGNGKMNGFGTFVYQDGSRYEGGWKDGAKCGHGKIVTSGGKISQEGEWKHDEFVGSKNMGPSAIGANDPCPCGSGRKYKNCHGNIAKSGVSAGVNRRRTDTWNLTEILDDINENEYDVQLVSIPPSRKLAVIGVILQLTGFGLADGKALAEKLGVVKSGLSKDEAESVKRRLEAAGASVVVRPS